LVQAMRNSDDLNDEMGRAAARFTFDAAHFGR
jgi:hypothetical protein